MLTLKNIMQIDDEFIFGLFVMVNIFKTPGRPCISDFSLLTP